jgi:hypothetical protein
VPFPIKTKNPPKNTKTAVAPRSFRIKKREKKKKERKKNEELVSI